MNLPVWYVEPSDQWIRWLACLAGPAHRVVVEAIGPQRWWRHMLRRLASEGWPDRLGMVEASDTPMEETPEWIAAEIEFNELAERKAQALRQEKERREHLEAVELRPIKPAPTPPSTPTARAPAPKAAEDPAIGLLAWRMNMMPPEGLR